jgi:prolyl-tRNA synthetase
MDSNDIMKYTQLFGKTVKTVNKNIKAKSHQLLVKAGFIRESTAGRYFFLPLGMRVRNKIVNIIRGQMNAVGGQEMITPVLHPLELWQETNRTTATGFELMKVDDRRGAQFALGGTAEEMIIDCVRKFPISYKDLPFNIYQFSQKFRDELRARSGLLRVREFLMKDAYSFHKDEQDFKREYQLMWETYSKIFEKMGLKTIVVASDNGYIGGDYCHEFVVENEVGESKFLITEDGSYCAHQDIAEFSLTQVNPDDEQLPFEIIDQPEWVHSMEDNVKHYGKESKFFLKNVVYKNSQGDIVIATIRGDLDVNPIKLQHVLNEPAILEEASEEELKAMGTKTGYVHAWDEKITDENLAQKLKLNGKVIYVADNSLKTVKNFIGGQKAEKTDSQNVNYGRDFKHQIEGDIALAQAGMKTKDGQVLIAKKGIEVGNIFQLGFHYSNLMKGAVFTDQDGQDKPFYMGCYGIGVGRTMQTIVEIHHDDQGIIWPDSIAPFQVYLINIMVDADEIYQKLTTAEIEVLYDDRDNVSPGQKFADADLIGCPIRLVISQRTNGKVEWKNRNEEKTELLELEEVLGRLEKI